MANNPIKRLFGQTAVYGVTTILGRLLNYFLVPLYTYTFAPDQYGVVTELYAYAVLLQILLTYGMETGFFRFSEKNYTKDEVFSTAFTSLLSTSSIFILLTTLFADKIAAALGYANHVEYIIYFALILGLDAVSAIFFARLRQQNKVWKFAFFKILNISLNIGFNLFFILLCPHVYAKNPDAWLCTFYNPQVGVGYIFISNLIASAATFVLFLPTLVKIRYKFNFRLWLSLLSYSLPLLITGLTGAINEVADRIMLKFLTVVPPGTADPHDFVMYQIGIYGANAKIAVIMMLFVQAFRYAAEPFFFSYAKEKDAHQVFADVMKYYLIFALAIFLFVELYLDVVKYFISPRYFEGLKVVLPLLLSRMFVGVFFLLSFWYKLTDRTHYGMVIFFIGAVNTIVMNYLLIPRIGYMGCAITSMTTYLLMVIISYLWGRKYLPIKYDFRSILIYISFATVLFLGFMAIKHFLNPSFVVRMVIATALLLTYAVFVIRREHLWQPLMRMLHIRRYSHWHKS